MDLAALMGGLVSEGSVTGNSRPSIRMNDRKVMEDLRDRADNVFKSSHGLYNTKPSELSENPRYSFEFDRNLEKSLLELNLGTGYAEDKRIPAVIRRSPKEYMFEFLRYLFEGDGGPSKKARIVYTSKSKRLCGEVQAVLMNAGIVSHVHSGEGKTPAGEAITLYRLSIYGAETVRFRDLIGFVSKKKQQRLDSLISAWERRTQDMTSVRGRIPGGREALARFNEKHRILGSGWVKDTTVPVLTQEKYTTEEAARVFNKSTAAVLCWIRKGLHATLAPATGSQFPSFEITRHDLAEFIQKHGMRRRVHVNVPPYEMRKDHLERIDLSYVTEKEPALAENLALLASEDLIWVQIREKDQGPVLPMGDLTVEETHSYLIDGVVVHNSGGNVSLRVIENLFIERIESLATDFLGEWLVPRIRAYFNLGPCEVHHKDFKMADDIQQKQVALNLRTTNTISDRTTLEELDFDYDKEKEQRQKELEARFVEQEKMQIASAETEAKVMIIRAKAQTEVNRIMSANAQQDMQAQMDGQHVGAQPSPQELLESPPEAKPPGTNGKAMQSSPLLMDMKAMNFMKMTQPQDMDYRLAELSQTDPMLAQIVGKKMQSVNRMTEALQPLPEQKPPRRGPGTAVI